MTRRNERPDPAFAQAIDRALGEIIPRPLFDPAYIRVFNTEQKKVEALAQLAVANNKFSDAGAIRWDQANDFAHYLGRCIWHKASTRTRILFVHRLIMDAHMDQVAKRTAAAYIRAATRRGAKS